MRQIHFCAWLLVTCSTLAACGGEKFTSSEQGAAANDSSGSAARSGGQTSSAGGTTHTSTGGKSAGAGTSTGGTAEMASGGSSEGGESNDGVNPCAVGSVTFKMVPSPALPRGYLCDAGCGTGWLTITDAAGATAFSIFSACGTASCESCELLPCAAAACLPTTLTPDGSELAWNGMYLAQDTCGKYTACQRQTCVPTGRYKAKACAAINGGNSGPGGACMPQDEQLCAEAEFDFPATDEVELVLQKL